ncbi:hypothetical protein [Streptomyces sp. SYSU K21746]
MSFDEEWSSARTSATANTSMRLNRADDGPSGSAGNADLSVNQDDLGAIGSEAYQLYQRLTRDGDHARPATFDASIALTNMSFQSGSALLKVHDRWNTQLRTLLDACANISNHLDYSKASHAKEENDIVAAMSASKIDEHFK